MKYLGGIIALICLLCSQSVFAQTDSSLAGRKALMFSFNGLNLGGGIGGKYWISSSIALRAQFTGSYSDATSNTLYSVETYSEIITIRFSPSVGIEKHFTFSDKLRPYFGGSIGYSITSTQNKSNYFSEDNYSKSITNTYSGTIFLGLEYWLNDTFSVSGEQALALSYYNQGHDYQMGFSMQNSTSSLMLSIYF